MASRLLIRDYVYVLHIIVAYRKRGKIRFTKLLHFCGFQKHRESFAMNVYLYYTSFI